MGKEITYTEFKKIDRNSKEQVEFIDGKVYLFFTPSVLHQIIVTNLSTEFGNYFKGKECRHFVAPFDVFLKDKDKTHKVQPDLTVICNKKGLGSENYQGIPTLVVEVLSTATESVDFIKKKEIYMKVGVNEYWIISPQNKAIQVFSLNKNGYYLEPNIYSKDDIAKSVVFDDLKVSIMELFE